MNPPFRILQLIDSLDAGGAERMAVNYANGLQGRAAFSALVATRKEGPLRTELDPAVPYLFLNRKSTFDWAALKRLRAFASTHQINVVHAHSTSFLLAVLLKFLRPKIKIIWHDHYGNSEFLSRRSSKALQAASLFFSGRIAVNQKLLDWGKSHLFGKQDVYFPNFVLSNARDDQRKYTQLEGQEGKRIICLANLREQKGHFFLLDIAAALKEQHPGWTFHLVGMDFQDAYSQRLRDAIMDKKLEKQVFVYGSCSDIGNVLRQCSIGILTSHSEGLPVAVLEYGLFGLPVVLTSVGEIPSIIGAGQGLLVPYGQVQAFVAGLRLFIEDENAAKDHASGLHKLIYTTFEADAVLDRYLDWLALTLKN